ncbi:type II toxin-antitoxin system RelE/ParE family toxin [Gilvimarinus sp. DA14]|uniref:type II toxin-antitoxin system RelE/ParE family toxin n=1 Tax=Gilvimarinus sp. DA14 TaxID=2956798 RepID=UPI0020B89569|nr:type II toxin-antitoxin system RelE/ParE family toxin [Gilvimarinus sp. DA14]UTF58926.1 type II toxin-antitoxin system RelE/ParE family toxin [Gilvimarinus sp. DA14]
MPLKWTDLAAQDLEIIEQYIAEDSDPSIAIDVVLSIINTAELILSQHPRAGRQGRVRNTRELVIDGLPFVVIYREGGSGVEVLRTLHCSQQWPGNG